jgi:hypothetical protein
MKIFGVEAELFNADKQTDWQTDMTDEASHDFAKNAQKSVIFLQ